jgi:hypothetical protein
MCLRSFIELVFNLDELGSVDLEDCTIKRVIVPAAIRKEDVYYSMSHCHRHITLLACVSATGDAITPLLITANPIHLSLWSNSFSENEDVMVRRRAPVYVNEDLFFEYISTVFIPYVVSVRNRPALVNQFTVLLMDSALLHL